jgi:hypothetical protein
MTRGCLSGLRLRGESVNRSSPTGIRYNFTVLRYRFLVP